jgi:hypothetical protein
MTIVRSVLLLKVKQWRNNRFDSPHSGIQRNVRWSELMIEGLQLTRGKEAVGERELGVEKTGDETVVECGKDREREQPFAIFNVGEGVGVFESEGGGRLFGARAIAGGHWKSEFGQGLFRGLLGTPPPLPGFWIWC